MTRCPVCGKPVDETQAPRAEYRGQVFYFGCTGCKVEFERDPERYAAARPRPHAAHSEHHH